MSSVILPSVFKDGFATVANGGTAVVGSSVLFLNSVLPGDFFGVHKGFAIRIASVEDDTHLTLANPWPGASQTTAAYEILLSSDLSRVQETTRQLLTKMQSGTLDSLAGLVGGTDDVIAFSGPGVLVTIPKSDLIEGVAFDKQVANIAARAAYDAQGAGFTVLVSDVGDGRSAIYTKASNTVGDWSAPAYITGPIGPMPTLAVASTTTLTPGAAATVTQAPVTGGYTLAFGIPAGKGFNPRGAYSGATAYVLGDVVTNAGSSWVLIVATSTGNAPPTLPTTSNTQWTLVASKGTDGTGIGDMLKSTYDPTNINASAFVRGNHTGDIPDSVLLANSTTNTKKLKHDLSLISAATTRTLQFPDRDIDFRKLGVDLISRADMSAGVATVDFLNLDDVNYESFELDVRGLLPAVNSSNLLMLVSTNNGSTWAVAGYTFGRQQMAYGASPVLSGIGAAGSTSVEIANSVNSTLADGGLSARLYFRKNSTGLCDIDWVAKWRASTAAVYAMGGMFAGANVNGIRFIMNSGNIAAGSIGLYGMRK